MNVHDSEKIAGIFSEVGHEKSVDTGDADVIVLNTCSIREKAEHKFYSDLGRLKKAKTDNPNLKIAVAGCIAQQEGEKLFKRFPYIDFVFGPNNIDSLQKLINGELLSTLKHQQSTFIDVNPDYPSMIFPMKRAGGVKAWVSIMYGCDNFCAYCVVPYTRGRERSRPSADIYREAEKLAADGFKEINLLGQNVNSYGRKLDEEIDFPELLSKLHEIDGIERIRFVTSHPKDFSEKLIKAMKDLPKVCNHMHLPIQAGSDKVLSLMNRKYTYNEYKEKIDLLKSNVPDIAITTDIIVGFPGETDEDFRLTMKALSEIEYDGAFAFKYSRRPGTKALELPDHVDEDIKSERLASVQKLQETISYKKNKELEGKTLEILVEGSSDTNEEKLTGRTTTNKIVNYHGERLDIGNMVNIRILEAKQYSLYGEKI
ncbi:(Dimethylallyl)adenosine tRNA methylthiotransferase MiaB [bacterium BMS3Bbin09]|nr:(Dimethylallyl)adenosine tRNA methylthiotransferase MiaB [bacterium BMS3Bbin09]